MRTRPRTMSAEGQCHAILLELQQAKGAWVAMPRLMEVSLSANIHTRIDSLRHDYGYTQIENDQRPIPGTRRRASFYRLPLPA
jgi:hypothetical protein